MRIPFSRSGIRLLVSLSVTLAATAMGKAADLQELQIVGRVLKFQEGRSGDEVVVAVAYNAGQPASADEAAGIVALVGEGLTVGDLTLRAALIEQNQLKTKSGFDAIFPTAGVDPRLLKAAEHQHGVPCLSRDVRLVSSGACTVAIQTSPGVAIFYNSANAAAVGVRFATAFVMMVHEL